MEDIKVTVIGLAQSGKTHFITSLLYNMLQGNFNINSEKDDNTSRKQYIVHEENSQEDPNYLKEIFPYNHYLNCIVNEKWISKTVDYKIYRYRLLVRTRKNNDQENIEESRMILTDYPGEMLLDLNMHKRSFSQWSNDLLKYIKDFHESEYNVFAAALKDGSADDSKLINEYQKIVNVLHEKNCFKVSPAIYLKYFENDFNNLKSFLFVPLPDDFSNKEIYKKFSNNYSLYNHKYVDPIYFEIINTNVQLYLFDLIPLLISPKSYIEKTKNYLNYISDLHFKNIKCKKTFFDKIIDTAGSWFNISKEYKLNKVCFILTKSDFYEKNSSTIVCRLFTEFIRGFVNKFYFYLNGKNIQYFNISSVCSDKSVTIPEDIDSLKKFFEFVTAKNSFIDEVKSCKESQKPKIDINSRQFEQENLDKVFKFILE